MLDDLAPGSRCGEGVPVENVDNPRFLIIPRTKISHSPPLLKLLVIRN